MVADATDPVLRLPEPAPLDAEARAHGVVNAEPEQLVRRRGRDVGPLDGAGYEPIMSFSVAATSVSGSHA